MDVDYGLGQRGFQMDLIEAGSSPIQSDLVQSDPVSSHMTSQTINLRFLTGDHEDKACTIRSLPPTSLAILLLTLHLSIHQLRADGPSLLIPTSPLLHGMLRFEVELCCQELILQHGPSFLDALLCHCPHAIKLLEAEVRNIEARQLPFHDGEPRQKTLIAECRCHLANTLGTNVEDNRKDMWSVLERIGALDEADVVKVIKGEELVTRRRQDSGVGL
jgi:hypothetical protein